MCPCISILSHSSESTYRPLEPYLWVHMAIYTSEIYMHVLASPSHTWEGVSRVYVDCTSHFHQFGLLVALTSAWSLIWYQSPWSWVRNIAFTIYPKLLPPLWSRIGLLSHAFETHALSLCSACTSCPLTPRVTHATGVEVYMWIVLDFFINSDFWNHETCHNTDQEHVSLYIIKFTKHIRWREK